MIVLARRIFAAMSAWPSPVRWALVALHVAGIWWLSSRVLGGGVAAWWVGLVFNGGHVVLFGGLAWLLAAALRARLAPRAWFAIVLAAGYGVVDEWHQSMVPGRSASFFDITTDASSALLLVQLALGAPLPRRRWSLAVVAIATAASVVAATFD